MLDFTNSRKALNFDLDDHLLKKNYPSKNYKDGWKDIKKFLLQNGFSHRQFSGYVSDEYMSIVDVWNIIEEMSLYLTRLKKCVKEFDITIVGNEYSLKKTINNAGKNRVN